MQRLSCRSRLFEMPHLVGWKDFTSMKCIVESGGLSEKQKDPCLVSPIGHRCFKTLPNSTSTRLHPSLSVIENLLLGVTLQ